MTKTLRTFFITSESFALAVSSGSPMGDEWKLLINFNNQIIPMINWLLDILLQIRRFFAPSSLLFLRNYFSDEMAAILLVLWCMQSEAKDYHNSVQSSDGRYDLWLVVSRRIPFHIRVLRIRYLYSIRYIIRKLRPLYALVSRSISICLSLSVHLYSSAATTTTICNTQWAKQFWQSALIAKKFPSLNHQSSQGGVAIFKVL